MHDILFGLLDFLISVVFEGILSLPAVPRNSKDWKRRRWQFVVTLIVLLLIVGIVFVLTLLNTYGIL